MAMYYSVDAFEEAGLNENDVPKTWDELLDARQEAHQRQALRRALRDHARLLPELHLVSLHLAGRRRVPDHGRQERVQLARRGAGAEVLAGRGQHGRRAAQAARRRRLGRRCPTSAPATARCRTSASGRSPQLREGAPDFKYGIFKLPTPPGGKYVTVGGGWAFVANAKGKNPEAAGEVLRLGARLDERRIRSSAWSTGAPRPRATCRRASRALEQGKAAFERRLAQGLHRTRSIPARAPSRACRRRSTRSSPTRSRRPAERRRIRSRRPQRGVRAARRIPCELQGRADPLSA